jgi:phosphotransferase system  glucose/maltose/N-acetylglucosamine-specific IIC component
MAMLALVLFDGLLGSKHWVALEDAVHAFQPALGDVGWLLLHSAGLLALWLAFLALYSAACALASAAVGGTVATLDIARAFAPTLIPIAVGYHFAHSFSSLLVQGQSLGFLVSDPFGLGWDLFGTRDFVVDIAIINTKTAWYLALGAIVAGHAISVYLAHVAAERLLQAREPALRALIPMTALMVLYTVISLLILAEPLVRYSGPQETII